jgi:hypothetical protein
VFARDGLQEAAGKPRGCLVDAHHLAPVVTVPGGAGASLTGGERSVDDECSAQRLVP